MTFPIISDSHGYGRRIVSIVDRLAAINERPDGIIFLGDGAREVIMNTPEDIRLYSALGNCDGICDIYDNSGEIVPLERLEVICGVRILMMHGHRYGTKALRTNVLNTSKSKDSTNSTTCDNTGTGAGGLKKHLTCAVLTNDLVRNGRAHEGYLNHILLSILNSLADCIGNLSCLSEAEAYMSISVAYYHDGCKTGDSTALYGLGYTV